MFLDDLAMFSVFTFLIYVYIYITFTFIFTLFMRFGNVFLMIWQCFLDDLAMFSG